MQRVQGCRGCRGAGLMSAGGSESSGVQRYRDPGVPGYHSLPLSIIDLVGDNRELEV